MFNGIIKWRPSLIGSLIMAATYMVAYFSGESLLFSLFLLGGIIVGYMVNENWKNGAINGLVSGIMVALIVNLISIILLVSQGYGSYLTAILGSLALYMVMEVVLCTLGGVLGFLVRSESLSSAKPGDKEN